MTCYAIHQNPRHMGVYPGVSSERLAAWNATFFPGLESVPLWDHAPGLLTALHRVESRGALESAHRIRIIAGQVFRYAVSTGRAERDPSGDLKGALPQPGEKHLAALIDAATGSSFGKKSRPLP